MLPAIPLDQMVANAQAKYQELFGNAAEWSVVAPGRVNLIGEHTDYNDGFVMPMAIERYVVIAAGRPESGEGDTLRVYSDLVDSECTIEVGQPVPDSLPQWGIYVRGVLEEMRESGRTTGPVQAVICANVPLAGGLSSSAALEVATATLVEAVTGDPLEGREKAKLCQRAENIHVGMPCGIMDQFSSALCKVDHLMQLDCRSLETKQVPFTDPDVTVLLVNTNVQRELASSAYPIRRGQCETAAKQLGVTALRDATMRKLDNLVEQLEEVVYRRARHVIGENKRVQEMAVALESGNWPAAGELMYASHDSLRDDYEVSCDELNLLVDTAHEIGANGGVIGSRLTGAGFGGCTVSLVRTDKVDEVADRFAKKYLDATGIAPTLFTTRPGPGAHVVS
ncbi:MAG: galactokinase [Aeoliella sp.]